MNWKNPDVHAHTSEMRAVLRAEYPLLPQTTRKIRAEFDDTLREIASTIGMCPCLKKMYDRREVLDGDMFDMSPAGLLCIVWSEIKKNQCFGALKDVLNDMGTTCVQGDTHRLFSLLVALQRSEY